jgi:hypothetical protein
MSLLIIKPYLLQTVLKVKIILQKSAVIFYQDRREELHGDDLSVAGVTLQWSSEVPFAGVHFLIW